MNAEHDVIGWAHTPEPIKEELERFREGLEHIQEYWNRDQNETAMADALWHIIETAENLLAHSITAKHGIKPCPEDDQ
jgi:hypothetical protein